MYQCAFACRSNSIVRCFAWHPHAPKYALALHDDSVCIHQAQPSDIVPTLKHKMQLSVADIAWKYDVPVFYSRVIVSATPMTIYVLCYCMSSFLRV